LKDNNSNCRVVGKEKKSIGEFSFENYGAHIDTYPTAYMNASATLGITKQDVDLFISRLEKSFSAYHHKLKKAQSKTET
jgi:O-phospho-L-seryl-tRNASec:L-selenocysteinyl-tRNA synthase